MGWGSIYNNPLQNKSSDETVCEFFLRGLIVCKTSGGSSTATKQYTILYERHSRVAASLLEGSPAKRCWFWIRGAILVGFGGVFNQQMD